MGDSDQLTRDVTSLVEFLLARITQEMVGAQRHLHTAATPTCDVVVVDAAEYLVTSPAAVLADCRSRLQAIELSSGLAYLMPDAGCRAISLMTAAVTLRGLASRYADHPGFDPAWRLPDM